MFTVTNHHQKSTLITTLLRIRLPHTPILTLTHINILTRTLLLPRLISTLTRTLPIPIRLINILMLLNTRTHILTRTLTLTLIPPLILLQLMSGDLQLTDRLLIHLKRTEPLEEEWLNLVQQRISRDHQLQL